jgi:hypothetical protein
VEFTDLSPEAIYQAKRFLLDSVGCYQQHDVSISLDVLDEITVRGKERNSPTSPRGCPVAKEIVGRAYCYEGGLVYLGSAAGFA